MDKSERDFYRENSRKLWERSFNAGKAYPDFSQCPYCHDHEERIIMISLKNGVLRINSGDQSRARRLYEFAFLLNMVIVFAFYRVPIIAPAAAVFMFVASFLVLLEKVRTG